ncbi:MAG TPA: hypothetical protein VLF40_05430 [Candidatus Saccharimonadales bacterium]|nr:hypothetical protein [Candidatus Saccharimonadales bacterium]
MNRNNLIAYSRQYLPHQRAEAAAQAHDLWAAGETEQSSKVMNDFYATAAEAAEQDARAFDVQALAEDHGATVVTAVRTYGNLGPFRPQNREDFKGVRVFDILLRPGQIACCSTVMPGDTVANVYGSWGVIVGQGKVHQAFPYDATSSVSDGQVHSPFLTRLSGMRPTEQIHQALYARPGHYNEINVSVDGVAGIFYCLGQGQSSDQDLPSKALFDLLAPYDIPQYVLQDGRFYPIEQFSDIELGDFGQPVAATDMAQNDLRLTAEQRDAMVAHLSEILTLAPRNAVTSGVARGQFAYDYRHLAASTQNFLREHEALLRSDNPSLRLYGATALHAFAELAAEQADNTLAERARALAGAALSATAYQGYKARILPSGNLRVTEPDLRHYLDTGKLPEHLQDH